MSSRYTTIILSMLHVAFKQVGHNVFKYVEVIGKIITNNDLVGPYTQKGIP